MDGEEAKRSAAVQVGGSELELGSMEDSKKKEGEDAEKVEPGGEKEQQEEEEKKQQAMVPFLQLFRYADTTDRLLIVLGSIGAMATGTTFPLFAVIFGSTLTGLNTTEDEIVDEVSKNALNFVFVGIGAFVASGTAIACWMYSAERQTRKVREAFLAAVLPQDIAWFDEHKPAQLASQLSSDSLAYASGIGDKVSNAIQNSVTFFAGVTIGLVRGWHLALVVLGGCLIIIPIMAAFTSILTNLNKGSSSAYKRAAGVVSDALSSIRTVFAFNAQERELDRYATELIPVESSGIKATVSQGLTMGIFMVVTFSVYGLTLWFGAFLIREGVHNPWSGGPYDGGDVMTVFLAVIIAAFMTGQVPNSIKDISLARAAALRMYNVIDLTPNINPRAMQALQPGEPAASGGRQLEKLQGALQFRDVHFTYPTRSQNTIFEGLDFSVDPGQTVAIVGESGCGKSTVVQLLERFYDPDRGQVLVDGNDLRELDPRWWRRHVGLVSQEPVLFTGTVRENILFGLDPSAAAASEKEVETAARAANAHDFITRLPQGYETHIGGVEGASLSGGQKQRVAIARAILRNPEVLILDEATSALDSESEHIVQEALDGLVKHRTTIVIAHRLSTIASADQILVLGGKRLLEKGTYEELLNRGGVFTAMVRAQERGALEGERKQQEQDGTHSPRVSSALSRHDRASASTTDPFKSRTLDGAQANSEEAKESGEQKDGGKKRKSPFASFNPRVFKFIDRRSSWLYFLIGVVGATSVGALQPVWAIIFGNLITVLFEVDPEEQEEDSRLNAILMFVIGLALGIGYVCQFGGMGVVGERLTLKVRKVTFFTIMRQELAWFDDEDHNAHVLSNRLAKDASGLHNGSTQLIAVVLQVLAALIAGLAIGFVLSWKLTLVIIATIPLMAGASAYELKIMTGFAEGREKAFGGAGIVAGEALSNIRTVAAFAAERTVLTSFSAKLSGPLMNSRRSSLMTGLGFGMSQLTNFLVYALSFYVGGILLRDGDLSFQDLMQAIFALIMAGQAAGNAMQMAPDFVEASSAQKNIFAILDRRPVIDACATEGSKPLFPRGAVELRHVAFSYPLRPDITVLHDIDLKIHPGTTMALVGSSGCGKSTIASLLLRFYDPKAGEVLVDGYNLTQMNVPSVRAQIGVVFQEPRLFDASIAANIRYGKPDATDSEVIGAAKQANAHGFIMQFKDGYSTEVGPYGGKLSGGQKQRVAIARALIRNPKILILDEATSALDSASEAQVQEAIEGLMRERNRTVLIIAHRLSTIRNADCIAVLDQGKVVELGRYDDLLNKQGVFASLAAQR